MDSILKSIAPKHNKNLLHSELLSKVPKFAPDPEDEKSTAGGIEIGHHDINISAKELKKQLKAEQKQLKKEAKELKRRSRKSLKDLNKSGDTTSGSAFNDISEKLHISTKRSRSKSITRNSDSVNDTEDADTSKTNMKRSRSFLNMFSKKKRSSSFSASGKVDLGNADDDADGNDSGNGNDSANGNDLGSEATNKEDTIEESPSTKNWREFQLARLQKASNESDAEIKDEYIFPPVSNFMDITTDPASDTPDAPDPSSAKSKMNPKKDGDMRARFHIYNYSTISINDSGVLKFGDTHYLNAHPVVSYASSVLFYEPQKEDLTIRFNRNGIIIKDATQEHTFDGYSFAHQLTQCGYLPLVPISVIRPHWDLFKHVIARWYIRHEDILAATTTQTIIIPKDRSKAPDNDLLYTSIPYWWTSRGINHGLNIGMGDLYPDTYSLIAFGDAKKDYQVPIEWFDTSIHICGPAGKTDLLVSPFSEGVQFSLRYTWNYTEDDCQQYTAAVFIWAWQPFLILNKRTAWFTHSVKDRVTFHQRTTKIGLFWTLALDIGNHYDVKDKDDNIIFVTGSRISIADSLMKIVWEVTGKFDCYYTEERWYCMQDTSGTLATTRVATLADLSVDSTKLVEVKDETLIGKAYTGTVYIFFDGDNKLADADKDKYPKGTVYNDGTKGFLDLFPASGKIKMYTLTGK